MTKVVDRKRLQTLIESPSVRIVRDEFKMQHRELFVIRNPELAFSPDLSRTFKRYWNELTSDVPAQHLGTWVYFPWSGALVHLLSEGEFQEVRSARNRNLVTEDEQRTLYGSTVGIAGLSIGSNVALVLALQLGARHLRLADFDTVDLSNLNRLPVGVDAIGLSKLHAISRKLYESDPYLDIVCFPHGLTVDSLPLFFDKVDVVVDEFDNLEMKLLLREEARRRKIPLVSGADVGERAVIDIERYDLDKRTKPFHGQVHIPKRGVFRNLDKRSVGGLIAQIVGLENHSARMLEWPTLMGKKHGLVSFPQVGSTAVLTGAAVAFCVRALLARWPVKNGRIVIGFDTLVLEPGFESGKRRQQALTHFAQQFGL